MTLANLSDQDLESMSLEELQLLSQQMDSSSQKKTKQTPTNNVPVVPDVELESMSVDQLAQHAFDQGVEEQEIMESIGGINGIKESFESALPGALQLIGGVGGAIAGAPLGPVGASAVSAGVGTAGRVAGETLDEVGLENTISGPVNFGQAVLERAQEMNPKERIEFGKMIAKTAAIETVMMPIGIVSGKVLDFVGKGVMRSLVGKGAADRGFERGFKRLLDPNFYKDNLPQNVVKETSSFFDRMTNVTGKKIKDLIVNKHGKTIVELKGVKSQVRQLTNNLLGKNGQWEDLLPDISKAEMNFLQRETQKILSLTGAKRRLPRVWAMRKNLDKLINSRRWKDSSLSYLRGLRRVLNDPIKSSGDDVAEAFHRYSVIKEAEGDLASKFYAVSGLNDEMYSQNLETFVSGMLAQNKHSTTARLKELNNVILGADDQTIENLLDYAAAETFQKEFGNLTMFSRIVAGMVNGRKSIARVGQSFQEGVGRGVVEVGKKTPALATTESELNTGVIEDTVRSFFQDR